MKVEYRIMGCRDRLPMVTHLSSVLGISQESVYIDMEMSGDPLQTQLHALSLPVKEDTTHICLLQDDCKVGRLFKDNVSRLIEIDTDCIFSLFVPNPKQGNDEFHNVVLRTGGAVCGLANIIPVRIINDYMSWWKDVSRYVSYKVDDATLAVYAKTHSIDVLTTVPSFVEHRCNDGVHSSALNHTHGQFMTAWVDLDANVSTFSVRRDLSLGEYNGSYLQKYIR